MDNLYDFAASLTRMQTSGARHGKRLGLVEACAIINRMMNGEKDKTRWYTLRDAREALFEELRRCNV